MMLEPFLATIAVVVPLLFTTDTQAPAVGVAGRVNVREAVRTYTV